MLTVCDNCDGSKRGGASPAFGVVEDFDEDKDLVLVVPLEANAKLCSMTEHYATEVEGADDDNSLQCSLNLSEGCNSIEADNDDSSNASESVSTIVSSLGDDDDLTSTQSTSDELENPVEPWEESSDLIPNWHVGDICVCKWSVDNKWYFAEITRYNHQSLSWKVRFLYFGAKQNVCTGDLRPIDVASWKRVTDEDNTLAAQAMLVIAGFRSGVEYDYAANPGKKVGKAEVDTSPLDDFHVDQLCICQFGGKTAFFYGKIMAINEVERICKVKLFIRQGLDCYLPFEDIYPCYSKVAELVTDDANVARMQRELVRQIQLPVLEPFLGAKAGKSDKMNGIIRQKSDWLKLQKLPPLWRFLLLESCGNDKVVASRMINSWYSCGIKSGYAAALKNREIKPA